MAKLTHSPTVRSPGAWLWGVMMASLPSKASAISEHSIKNLPLPARDLTEPT